MANGSALAAYREAMSLAYQHSKRDLGLYVQEAWETLEPVTELKWNWHHDYIAEHLHAAALGQIRRLIINVCPRSTKSLVTSVCFPTWLWIADPATRFLFGSYKEQLATKQSVLRRNLIESPWYQQGYGHRFRLSSDSNTKGAFTNNKTGHMISGGVKSAPTGEGGDYIIIDDPHNPKGALSTADRERVCDEFDTGWTNRLNDKKTGRIILIMQRLHAKDLTGHILSKNQGYVHLKIPSIAEERERLVFPVSGRVVNREKGDLMHPDRDGVKELEDAKVEMGPYGFSGQHQQSPTPKSGGVFKRDMFDFVDTAPKETQYVFVTADTAYSEKKENDFTVFSAWAVTANGRDRELWLLDCYRKQIAADKVELDVVPFLKRFSAWGFRGAWIEPKGHGIYLNGALPKTPHGIMVPSEDKRKAFFKDRTLDKVERANNAVPHLAGRKIKVVSGCADRETLLAEALSFPKGVHDDFVDTLVDAIKFVFARTPGSLDVPI